MHFRLLFILALSLLLSACGFQLRGAQFSDFTNTSIYLDNRGAAQLTEQVRLQLEGAGASITGTAQGADYIVTLKQERFEKSVLSVSASTGKVEEFLITYSASMDASEAGGKTLVSNDPISLSRDYIFDEGAVLGKFSEETEIRQDLVFRSSSQVLRRLQALIASNQ